MNSENYGTPADDLPSPHGDYGPGFFESENAKAFAAAADFIRKSLGSDAYSASWDRVSAQEQVQVVKLPAAGLAAEISEDTLDAMPVLSDHTSEHKVMMPFVATRVTKSTWPGVFGQIPIYKAGALDRRVAFPSEYLLRQALQVEIFASDIKLEGVAVSSKQSMIIGAPKGEPSFVISQGFVSAADTNNPTPSEEQIAEFMKEHGFQYMPHSHFGWLRPQDGVAVVDAKPDNFILSVEGVVPIDLQIAVIPEFIQEAVASSIIIPATEMPRSSIILPP